MFSFIRISPILLGRWRVNVSKDIKNVQAHYANLDHCGSVECKKIENYKLIKEDVQQDKLVLRSLLFHRSSK